MANDTTKKNKKLIVCTRSRQLRSPGPARPGGRQRRVEGALLEQSAFVTEDVRSARSGRPACQHMICLFAILEYKIISCTRPAPYPPRIDAAEPAPVASARTPLRRASRPLPARPPWTGCLIEPARVYYFITSQLLQQKVTKGDLIF